MSYAHCSRAAEKDERFLCSFGVHLTFLFFVATVNHADRVRREEGCRQPRNHGVSLALAEQLDWDAALVWVDTRYEYHEWRMIALAPESNTLYYVAFVERDEAYRIISLRKATRREVKYYVENN